MQKRTKTEESIGSGYEKAPFTPYSGAAALESIHIACVGLIGCGRKTFVRYLAPYFNDGRFKLVVHMVEQLSMLQPADQIDFILLFTDITSMMSVLSTKADTETIHPLFASGRTCFVVTHVDLKTDFSVSSHQLKEDVLNSLSEFQVPAFFVNLKDSEASAAVSAQIGKLIQLAARHVPGVSPLITACAREVIEEPPA